MCPMRTTATDKSLRRSVTKFTFSNKLDVTLVGHDRPPPMRRDHIPKKRKEADCIRLGVGFLRHEFDVLDMSYAFCL
jgi:hypothetical protein